VIVDAMLTCHLSFSFSSRRRHTRFSRDWSSDVCSSDLWFKDNDQESFIGIPAEDLTEKEISLLHTLFPLDNNNWSLSNIANEWREFLLHNGPLPQSNTNNIRFIHFTITDIRDEFLFSEWEEAIKSLFYN